MDRGEHSFVTFLSKLIPILVPTIPAYVSYQHVIKQLEFHWLFGFAYALVVEGLGYAAIYKGVQFWEWNRHYKTNVNRMPVQAPVIIYVTYLIVILWVNVMLDWQSGVVWYKVVAVACISLLSVPAGLLLSISAIHTERILQKEARRTNNPKESNTEPNTKRTAFAKRTNGADEQIRSFVKSIEANEHRTPGPTEIANALSVSKSYASETLSKMKLEDRKIKVK